MSDFVIPPAPTGDDLARDLARDYADAQRVEAIEDHGRRADVIIRILRRVAPAAIRRALAAEAEVKRLQRMLDGQAAKVAADAEVCPQPGGFIAGEYIPQGAPVVFGADGKVYLAVEKNQ